MTEQHATVGLTSTEAAQRAAQGLGNRVRRSDAAEYRDIVVRNLLTLFNLLVAPAAAVLFALDDYRAAVGVSGMAVVNTLIGLVQELRAKRQLDRLTLLAESRVRVLRDGIVQEIAQGDVVQGDCLLLTAGDPVVADGVVIEARFLEIDEALLTGESDPVPRRVGDELLSGSFCVAGEGRYRADRVGLAAFAQKTAAAARTYQYTATPLQADIDRLIRLLTALAVLLSLGYIALYFLRGNFGVDELTRMVAATITSMVPQGLVLMTTLALLLGAVRLTALGAVINRLAAVEAMASIDTLCLDKTGTLTTNRLSVARLEILGGHDPERVRRWLRLFASCSLDQSSKALAALRQELGPASGELLDQLPFKSQNRLSAVRVRADDGEEVVLVLGAPEAVCADAVDLAGTDGSHRLLLLARATSDRPRFDGSLAGFSLEPVARIALRDELRPQAGEVLRLLAEQGIRFKVISGDHADTVRATVAPLGIGSPLPALAALAEQPVVSGRQLEDAANLAEQVERASVFGRVTPAQKVQIVRALRQSGRQVAMIGDGVNDVLPIKNANLGIAMGEGSRASQTVAGVVLRTNDFGLLPQLLDEGRLILRNLRRASKLFLVKNAYTLFLIVAALGVFALPFPFAPQQVTLLNFLTIGVPALFIALDRERAAAAQGDFLAEVGWFALTTGCAIGLAALIVLLVSSRLWQQDEQTTRTLVVVTLVLLGWGTLYRVLADGAVGVVTRGLRLWPACGLVLLLLCLTEPLATFFELRWPSAAQWALLLGVTITTSGLLMLADRLGGSRGTGVDDRRPGGPGDDG